MTETASPPLLSRQFERLKEVYPDAVISQRPDGSCLITVSALPMPPGWDRQEVTISIILPPGYPTAKPSGFETAPDLRLADQRVPSAGRGEHSIDGRQYSHFCWQPNQQWDNDDNELWKRVKFALVRFAEHLN